MAVPRPAITCHVLDTTAGRPAASIPVKLKLQQSNTSSQLEFTSETNSDGRVVGWNSPSNLTLQQVFDDVAGNMLWVIQFDTQQYWEKKGIKPFFPNVHVNFITTGFKDLTPNEERPHWHVPLLLGPYNYTTYRGS